MIELNKNEMSKIESSIDELGVTRVPSAANFVTTFWESEKKEKIMSIYNLLWVPSQKG